jgi:hypothetical protein
VRATAARPHLKSPLHSFPALPEHLGPVVESWQLLGGLEGGARPGDVRHHLDLVGIEDQEERERVYRGVMVLEGVMRQWRAEQSKTKAT